MKYIYENMPMQYTTIFHGRKNDNFQMKNYDSFLIFAQNIIQLMHSFEVNIRICQPEKAMSTESKPRWTSLSRAD